MKTPDRTLFKSATYEYERIRERKPRGYLSVNDDLEVMWDRDLKRRPLTVRYYYSPETGLIYNGRS